MRIVKCDICGVLEGPGCPPFQRSGDLGVAGVHDLCETCSEARDDEWRRLYSELNVRATVEVIKQRGNVGS